MTRFVYVAWEAGAPRLRLCEFPAAPLCRGHSANAAEAIEREVQRLTARVVSGRRLSGENARVRLFMLKQAVALKRL